MNKIEVELKDLTKDSAIELALGVIRALDKDYSVVISILEDALELDK